MRSPENFSPLAKREPRSSGRGRPDVPRVDTAATATVRRIADRKDRLLPRDRFLDQLIIEKRRSERAKSPLSMLVVSVDRERGELQETARRLARALLESKRDTDYLGYLADDTVALLLTDTVNEGARKVSSKLRESAAPLVRSISVGTYPDNLFDQVLADNPDTPQPDLADTQPLMLLTEPRSTTQLVTKRVMDLFGAALALLLLSPLMLLTALLVRLSSPGPVIFRQTRLGRHGMPFTFYKFRSMRIDSDDSAHRAYTEKLIRGEHAEINQGDAGTPVYKMKSDPRITRVGRFIRATSIDELPQLFNVLNGDMSLVGPRPPLAYEAAKYQAWHLRRVLEIRPGITGLWQVEGRSRTTFDEMVRLDLRYIREWSPLGDLLILLKTVRVVLLREGGA